MSDRKVDKLAGKKSFLDKLKDRRKAIEGGDASGKGKRNPKQKDKSPKY